MIFSSVLLAVSAIFTAIANDMFIFNVFRIVGGVGIGLCSVASPMYIAEIAPARRRGSLGVMYQLAIILGSIIAPLVAYFLAKYLDGSVCWRWMFFSEMASIAIFVLFLFFLPKSPRWLAERGEYDQAFDILERIENTEHARIEMDAIKSSLSVETGKLSEIIQPGLRYALFIGIMLAFFNNWTGWSVMGGYIPMLFEMSGLEERAVSILQFAITYGFMGIMGIVSILIIDRVGRKPMWIVASFGMAIVTGLTGLVFHFQLSGIIVLLVLLLCAMPHGLALGPLPWLMMSEIFPTKIRAKAVAVTTAFLWVMIFTAAYLFPVLTRLSEKTIGSVAGVFWLFTLICIISALFGFKVLPETKGKTLEQISELLKRKK